MSYLFLIGFSFLLTFFLTPLTIIFAKKIGLVDDPKIRPHPAHTHKGKIPRAGGISIYLGIFLPLFLFYQFNMQIFGIFLGATVLLIVGLWDDKKDRSPYIRFFLNCVVAIIAILFGITIPYITSPFGGVLKLDVFQLTFTFGGIVFVSTILSDILTMFWIVWTTNIVGWSGGVDGQLPGFVGISAIIIGLLSLRFVAQDPSQLAVTYLSFFTAGAYFGFLPWNFFPQKIMPGYSGKTIAGFMLAVLSILAFSKLGTALLVLIIPMTDAVFVFIKRLLAGKSPVYASSGHLHHMLLQIGWSKRKIAFFYWTVSLLTGVAALTLSSRQKIFVAVGTAVCILGFLLWIHLMREITSGKQIE